MKQLSILRCSVFAAAMLFTVPALVAQNSSIQLFGPVNVRPSTEGTGTGASANTFNSKIVNLTCTASPITAVLSSSANGVGNILVDNYVAVSQTGTTTTSPVNVCTGGTGQNCFTSAYQSPASSGTLNGVDPDTLVATGGVAPINISSDLSSGPIQLEIDLIDNGGWLTSSSLYLTTNCTQTGTGPANITGNPISQSNPTPAQLNQSFPFNSSTNQQINFTYDLSQAEAAGTLTIQPQTIPGTEDTPVDPTTFQTDFVQNTSFATSSCLVHTGELLNSAPACKLFTLECTVGTGSTESGAQCPVSSIPNEVFQDVFDGPSFTLPDITNSNGTTFHEGVGFLMASEGWSATSGGPCSFDPASGLEDLPCPQNLLTSISGPGAYSFTGITSHPNSTFIPVVRVPEDLTTVTVAGQHPGGWVNTSTPQVTLSSQPPNLAGTNLPGAANFVPAPIQSITYGISAANAVPVPTAPASTDTVVENPVACPTDPTSPQEPAFATPQETLNSLPDGKYLLHYYAQDCAGTLELQFTQDASQSWSTSYYTVPINIDTVAPLVASGPVLSPAPSSSGSYTVGQAVTATYSCTDMGGSGVVTCGTSTYPGASAPTSTGVLTSTVDTSSPGTKTYTVTAIDAAGNQSSASVNYTVIPAGIPVQLSTLCTGSTIPHGADYVCGVYAGTSSGPAQGVITYQVDGGRAISAKLLFGVTLFAVKRPSVGQHTVVIGYAAQGKYAAANPATVSFTVVPRR